MPHLQKTGGGGVIVNQIRDEGICPHGYRTAGSPSHPMTLRARSERGESRSFPHYPGKNVYLVAQAFGRKSLCAKQAAALRCTQLPGHGGAYAKDNVVEWRALSAGMFGMPRLRTADRQVRSDSSRIGSGPRVDGDKRGHACDAEA